MISLAENLTENLTGDAVRHFLLDYFSAMIVANGLKPQDLADDFDLLKAGIVDSLGLIEMISAVEKYFNITVDFEALDPGELAVLGAFSRFVAENATSNALHNKLQVVDA